MTLTPLPPLPALVMPLAPLPPLTLAPLPSLAPLPNLAPLPPGTDLDTFAGVGNAKPLPPLVLENLKWLNAPEGMQAVDTMRQVEPLPPLELADPNPDNSPHLGHFPVCATCDGVGIVEPGDGCPTCNGSGTTTPAPGDFPLCPECEGGETSHVCGTCDGTGWYGGNSGGECYECNSSGVTEITCPDCGVMRAGDIAYCMDCPDTADCPVCQAQGTVDGDQKCMVCFGSGKVSQAQADAINDAQYAPWQNVETAPWQDGVYEVQIRFGEIVRLEWGSARRRWYYPGGEYVTDYESLGTVAVGWRGLTRAAYLQALEKLP